jgi:hypothetical protein
MTDPEERLRERELERRRENELKDLEVEDTHGERPLEGLSRAPTTWTPEQDDSKRSVHARDEAEARARSRARVPPPPAHDEE